MKVYESVYWSIYFEEENKLLITVWNQNSARLNKDLYQKEMLEYAAQVETYKPKRLIVDSQKFFFPITPDMQGWTNNTVFPRVLAAGMSKVAIILAPDIISQMGMEQTMEENVGLKFQTRYFDKVSVSREWLMAAE